MNTILQPSQPTADELLQQQAKQLAIYQASVFASMQDVNYQTALFVWNDPTIAQSKFDAFTAAGFDASDLITNSTAFITMMATLGTTVLSPVPDGYSLTINGDNSVTVIAPQS